MTRAQPGELTIERDQAGLDKCARARDDKAIARALGIQPNWRARARRTVNVDHLIREAAYFERIASAIELRAAIDELVPF